MGVLLDFLFTIAPVIPIATLFVFALKGLEQITERESLGDKEKEEDVH